MTSPVLSPQPADAEPASRSQCAVARVPHTERPGCSCHPNSPGQNNPPVNGSHENNSHQDTSPQNSSQRSKRNVLIASPYVFGVGGVAVAIQCISGELTNRGYEVVHLARGSDTFIKPLAGETSHPTYTVQFRHLAPTLKSRVAFWMLLPLSCINLAWFLTGHKIDQVFIQYPVPGHLPLAMACRWLGIGLCVTFQGSDAHRLQTLTRTEAQHLRSLLRMADSITTVSRSLAEKVLAFFPALEKRSITVIPNGTPQVPPAVAQPLTPARKLRITAVGRLIHRKGFDVLIRAIGLLEAHASEIDCRIIGEGPELDSLQDLIRRLELDGSVQLVGSMDHASVLGELQATDIFVLSSRAEGAALVLAEAMASRCAVVSTAVDGALEAIVPGDNGLLVGVEKAEELAAALAELVKNRALRLRLASSGFAASRELLWDRITDRYLQVTQCCACHVTRRVRAR